MLTLIRSICRLFGSHALYLSDQSVADRFDKLTLTFCKEEPLMRIRPLWPAALDKQAGQTRRTAIHHRLAGASLGWLLCCLLWPHSVLSQPDSQSVVTPISAQLLSQYEAAAAGDSDATEQAFAALNALAASQPDNPLLLAVLGSTGTMMARDSFIPWRALKYLETGMAQIDKGISLLGPSDSSTIFQGVPVTLWVRNTAGCTYIEVPKMFNRLESGYRILQDAINSAEAQQLPFEKLASTYLCAGQAAQKLGEQTQARSYLQAVLNRLPGTPQAQQAAALLKG